MESSKFKYRVVTDAEGYRVQWQSRSSPQSGWHNMAFPSKTVEDAKESIAYQIALDDFVPEVVEL